MDDKDTRRLSLSLALSFYFCLVWFRKDDTATSDQGTFSFHHIILSHFFSSFLCFFFISGSSWNKQERVRTFIFSTHIIDYIHMQNDKVFCFMVLWNWWCLILGLVQFDYKLQGYTCEIYRHKHKIHQRKSFSPVYVFTRSKSDDNISYFILSYLDFNCNITWFTLFVSTYGYSMFWLA